MENPAELLKQIHKSGYLRVHIRPTEFHAARLRDTTHCHSVILQAAVATNGWQYPIVMDTVDERGPDWIAGKANLDYLIEYWRFFQSGQFVHHLALREDHWGPLGIYHPQFFVPAKDRKYLSVTQAISTVTDIIEFGARLAYRGVLVPRALLSIEFHGMAGRELTYMTPGRRLPASFWFQDESVRLEGSYKVEELIGRPREIAIQLSGDLFKRAGWDAPATLVADDQSQYTANRS